MFNLWAAVIVTAVLLLVIVPPLYLVADAFVTDGRLTFAPMAEAFDVPGIGRAARNTALLVAVSGVLAMVIGGAFAWLNERTDANFGVLGTVLPLAPLLIPQVALVIGWVFLTAPRAGFLNVAIRALLDRVGIHLETGPLDIYSWYGMIFLYTIDLVPFVFLILSVGFRNHDSAQDEASRVSGGSLRQTLWRVTLPSIRPALGAAFFLLVLTGVSLYSVPAIIGQTAGVDALSVRIINLLTATFPAKTDAVIGLNVGLIGLVMLAWIGQRLVSGPKRNVASRLTNPSVVTLGKWRWVAKGVVGLFLACTSVLPLLSLAIVSLQKFWRPKIDFDELSFDSYRRLWASEGIRDLTGAFQNSLMLAIVGATIIVVLMTTTAVSARRFPGWRSSLIEAAVRLPMGLSHMVLALSLIVLFAGPPFNLYGTLTILMLGYLVFSMPRTSVVIDAALRQVGDEMEEASFIAGAGRGRTFVRIQMPLIASGLAVAWALCVVAIMGDLTGSVLLSTGGTPVLGPTILGVWEAGVFPTLAALATVVSLLTSALVCAALWFARMTQRRRGGRSPVVATEASLSSV